MLEQRSFISRAIGDDLRYTLIVPDDVPGPLPVVYLLHGRGDSAASWEPVLDDLRALPVIAVLPDAPWSERASYYVDSAHRAGRQVETALTGDLVDHVEARLPEGRAAAGRASRTVAGYSMGGYGALRFGLAHPQLFGQVVALSPAAYDPEPPAGSSARTFGAFGVGDTVYEADRYRTLSIRAALDGYAGMPLSIDLAVGDAEQPHPGAPDALSLVSQTAAIARLAADTRGITVRARTYPGAHDFTVWRPALLDALSGLLR
ncbi:hypothetical protein ASE16_18285 [Leifsonia sp. Root227]|uniref:alpha/beta hydrolase n=1 Tax=Leifsonia sp. Root227 TaxID=1736496 RepID=UPI0006FEAA64|nr:alpha/beta fold hydrolase [Leifsonia sp. Root227]KRC47269.1 hypothetical protein ASE16_18285 [Leifsonia sp. Root227]